jgi:pathogenesis-related protein 1
MNMKFPARIVIGLLLVLLLGTMTVAAVSVEDRTIILGAHNTARIIVGTAPISWSTPLETSAQNWANQLRPGKDPHSHTGGLGENVAQSSNKDWKEAVDYWALEQTGGRINGIQVARYTRQTIACDSNYNMYDYASQHAHYTQMVWDTTQYVGCGDANYQGNYYYVCQYSPPGNICGNYPYSFSKPWYWPIKSRLLCYKNGGLHSC